MRRIGILGVGSPFGDDRIGWEVVETLEREGLQALAPGYSIELATCVRPLSSYLERLQSYARVLIVDAVVSGAPPGRLHRIELPEAPDPQTWKDASRLSSHGADVMQALLLGRTLKLLPPTVVVFGIEIGGAGSVREPEVRLAVPRLAERIQFELEHWQQFT